MNCMCKLPENDTHLKCFKCLGPYHLISGCGPCQELPPSSITLRKKAQNIFLTTNKWPSSLEAVASSEGSYVTSKTHLGASTSAEVPHEQQSDQNQVTNQDTNQNIVEEGEEDVMEVEQEIETLEDPAGGVHPSEGDEGEMFQRFKAFMARGQEFTRGPKRPQPSGGAIPKKPKFDIEEVPQFKQLKSQVQNIDTKMDLIINKLSSGSAPEPVHERSTDSPRGRGARQKTSRINVRQDTNTMSELNVEDLVEGDDEVIEVWSQGEYEQPDDWEGEESWLNQENEVIPDKDILSRRAARNLWLAGLSEVCPNIPAVKPVKASSTRVYFKSLKEKEDKLCMPFLSDVMDVCVETQVKKIKNILPRFETFYPTDKSMEAQLFSPRNVQYTLAKEVPLKNLKEQGMKQDVNRLNPKTHFGLQEKMAIESSQYAEAYLRLSNNFQLACMSLEKIVEKCQLQASLLGSKVFKHDKDKQEVQESMEVLIHQFNIMSLAIKDIDFTNGDFLTAAAHQYATSAQNRTSAWVEASSLPKAVKKQLLSFDPDTAKQGSVDHLNILSKDAENFLQTFVANRKDQDERQVLLKSLKTPHPKQTQQSKPQYKTPLQENFQEYTRAQTSWNSERGSRGSSRGNRGGKRSRGRGRGRANSRPFPKGGKNNKQ